MGLMLMVALQQSIRDVVPDVSGRTQGYCGGSLLSIDDSIPVGNTTENVVGVGKVELNGTTVGWVYRTDSGKYFAQSNRFMPLEDQKRSNTVLTLPANPDVAVAYKSKVSEVLSNPWPDLMIVGCQPGDFTPRP